jgi:serine/threonine protein kinase
MAQLADVLVYLQGMSVVHRNIKPENVLCELADGGSVRVVLGDFGEAVKIGKAMTLSSRCGSPGFIAPELFREHVELADLEMTAEGALTITKIDVFSFGMLISTVLTGRNPFRGETHADTYRNNAELSYDPGLHFRAVNTISDQLRSLLTGVCAPDPRMRYSASEASAHPWFSSTRNRVTHADLHQIQLSRASRASGAAVRK